MKLTEMANKPTAKQMNKVMESRFGFSVDYDNLTFKKAFKLATAMTEALDKIKTSHGVHLAEKNPRYMEMLMMRESIHSWMRDNKQQLITESEMAKSEAILAAKDMVDSIQDMLEKIGKMQNEQLPALLDTIRDQLGIEQADGFKGAVSPLLQQLAQTLQQGRETADTAARQLAGEQTGGGDMGMGAPAGGAAGPDLGPDLEAPGAEPGMGAVDAAAGGTEELGRERRGVEESMDLNALRDMAKNIKSGDALPKKGSGNSKTDQHKKQQPNKGGLNLSALRAAAKTAKPASDLEEGAKPDFHDVDNDKNKKESWKQAAKDAKAKARK